MKPILHLLGDRFTARKYLWFAEKKLAELKIVMDLQRIKFGQRTYRLPDNSIEVYIESRLGIDKIRIAAVTEGRINIPGDVAVTLPVPVFLGSFVRMAHFDFISISIQRPTPVIDIRTRVWDENGTEVFVGRTQIGLNDPGSGNAIRNEQVGGPPSNVPQAIFEPSGGPYYYGVQYDFNRVAGPTSDFKLVDRDPLVGLQNFQWDIGSSSWILSTVGMETNLLVENDGTPSGWQGSQPLGSGMDLSNSASLTICSPSIPFGRVAVKVQPSTLIILGDRAGKAITTNA